MDALILGGLSPRHHEGVREVADVLAPQCESVKFLDYRHWPEPGPIDMTYEIGRATALAEELSTYVVVAKSIGTVVATLAIAQGKLHPRHCVFMGFPLSGVQTHYPEVAEALASLPPTVFLHNEHDTVGSAVDVQSYLHEHTPSHYVLNVLPGDTHDYVDFGLIATLAAAT